MRGERAPKKRDCLVKDLQKLLKTLFGLFLKKFAWPRRSFSQNGVSVVLWQSSRARKINFGLPKKIRQQFRFFFGKSAPLKRNSRSAPNTTEKAIINDGTSTWGDFDKIVDINRKI